MPPPIELAPGADENGFAVMLADLVRQNAEASPAKARDLAALRGTVAIAAEDAGVALTLRFHGDRVTVHDGIDGVPDLAIRGDADDILALSNLPPLTPRTLQSAEARKLMRSVGTALARGRLRLLGAFAHLPILLRLSRVLSVT